MAHFSDKQPRVDEVHRLAAPCTPCKVKLSDVRGPSSLSGAHSGQKL